VSLGQNVFVGNKVTIGDHCKVQNNVSVYDNVTLEEGVFCGPSMVFTNVYNPRSLIERKNEYRNTLVKKGATLGANCTIVCGVTIGEYAFIDGELAPDTVNPSLWRMARLNLANGLFKVTDRLYQLRGFDIANMTVIEGSDGRIVIDPLTSVETARAALALVDEHLGARPVTAVIYTHSHVDHFGGALGVLTAQEATLAH